MSGERVELREVAPRDGLQNEPAFVPAAVKIDFVEALAAAGLPYVEVTSFVSPKWIPALADGLEVARAIRRRPGTRYAALVPNRRGYETFRAAGTLDVVAVFLSATETHNRKNVAKSIDDTLSALREIAQLARADGLSLRGYVSTVFGCPYEGKTPPENVERVVRELLGMDCQEVSLGDTIGVGNPRQVREVLSRLHQVAPAQRFSLHFHDTRGTALANALAAFEAGARKFDGSAGGIGGCPYAPGAAGNVATEELVVLFESMGVSTGVDLDALVRAARGIAPSLGHELPGRYIRAHASSKPHCA
jgi:hydroxymethylglutaryl-CoA lyase